MEERPIAGTQPRGRTEEEDARLASEMRADPKERAEHVMLVDLGRNDVGRVSRIGSVEVSEFMVVERYSHVMHLVSHVRGRLEPGKDAFDVLAACFPAGTLTGAPKIRAMEIIEELEPTRRGPYAGAVGYISYSRQPGFVHHHPHRGVPRAPRVDPGRGRHRGRLGPEDGMARDVLEGPRR